MSTEETEARLLAEWLATPPGTPPPEGLSASAVQAVYALRPDRAPAPRITIDDVFSTVTTGPYAAAGRRGQARAASGATPVDRSPARRPAPSARRWWAAPAVGLALSAALAAIVVIPVAGHYFSRGNEQVSQEVARSDAAPMAAPASEPVEAPAPVGGAAPPAPPLADLAPGDASLADPKVNMEGAEKAGPAPVAAPPSLPEMAAAPSGQGEAEARRESQSVAPAAEPAFGSGGLAEEGTAAAPPPPPEAVAEADDVLAKTPSTSTTGASGGKVAQTESKNDTWDWGRKKSSTPTKNKAADAPAAPAAAARPARSESAADEEAPAAERAQSDKDEGADPRARAVPTDYRNDWYNTRSDVAAVYALAESQRAAGQPDSAVATYLTLLGDADRRVGQDVAWRAARIHQSAGRLAEAQRLVKQGLSFSAANTPQRANLLVLDGDLSLARGDATSAARSWAEAQKLNDAR